MAQCGKHNPIMYPVGRVGPFVLTMAAAVSFSAWWSGNSVAAQDADAPKLARGALVRVAGGEPMMFVRIDTLLIHLEPGDQCLILGVNDQGQVVRYGENPLDLHQAHIIATRTILPLQP